MQPDSEIGSVTSVNGGSAVVLVTFVAILTIGPFALALWRFFVHRGRALRAETAEKQPHPAVPGDALLHGIVETEDGGPAIRIEIDQTGQEWANKGSWSHRWTESARRVNVRRFRLRLTGDDTVVMVDPDERVHLIDTLDTENLGDHTRLRVSELSHGEKAWISGVLVEEGTRGGARGAYRSGPGTLVLCGTRAEPLEIASDELGSQFTHWRRYYLKACKALGLVVLVVHGLLLGPFYALLWLGKVASCHVTHMGTYVTTNKGHSTTHYVLHAHMVAGSEVLEMKDEVSYAVYSSANRQEMLKVPFIYVPILPALHSIGGSADVNAVALFLSFFAGVLCSAAFPISRNMAKPWYEQRKVVEGGSGRLEQGAYAAQVPG